MFQMGVHFERNVMHNGPFGFFYYFAWWWWTSRLETKCHKLELPKLIFGWNKGIESFDEEILWSLQLE